MTACRQPSLGESATKGVLSLEAHKYVQTRCAIEGAWQQIWHMVTEGCAADALHSFHTESRQRSDPAWNMSVQNIRELTRPCTDRIALWHDHMHFVHHNIDRTLFIFVPKMDTAAPAGAFMQESR